GTPMDPAIDAALRTALSFLFLAAAAHKLRDPRRFRATLAEYHLLAPGLVSVGAAALVVVEVGLAVALVLPPPRWSGLLTAVGLGARGRGPLHIWWCDGGESRARSASHRLWMRRAGRSPADQRMARRPERGGGHRGPRRARSAEPTTALLGGRRDGRGGGGGP